MPRSQLIPLLLIKKWKQREGCLFHLPVPVHTPVFIQTGSHCSSSVSVARRSPSFLWKTGCHPFSSIQGLFFIYPLSPTLSIFSFLWDRSHLLISMLNYLPLTKERKIQRIKLKKKKKVKKASLDPVPFSSCYFIYLLPVLAKLFKRCPCLLSPNSPSSLLESGTTPSRHSYMPPPTHTLASINCVPHTWPPSTI